MSVVYAAPNFETLLKNKGKSNLTIGDLTVLFCAGEAILKTNKEIKGENRRALRLAVNRARQIVKNA